MEPLQEKVRTFALTEKELKMIMDLLDLALKAGGLANKPTVDALIKVFAHPIEDDKAE